MYTSSDVIAAYLNEIYCLYEEFIKDLSNNCSNDLIPELYKIYYDVIQSHKYYSTCEKQTNELKSTFKIKLLQKAIFEDIFKSSPKNIHDLYDVFINIESNILFFLKTYFNTFPYIKYRNELNTIIYHKESIIKLLRQDNSA